MYIWKVQTLVSGVLVVKFGARGSSWAPWRNSTLSVFQFPEISKYIINVGRTTATATTFHILIEA